MNRFNWKVYAVLKNRVLSILELSAAINFGKVDSGEIYDILSHGWTYKEFNDVWGARLIHV